MDKKITNYAELYEDTLLDGVIPFWINNSIDKENGGFFTCLDEKGKVFETDKFIWLQARQVWMFSKLFNHYFLNKNEKVNQETLMQWKKIAEDGAKFLEEKCKDKDGNFYFVVKKDGSPLIHPFNIFSDCFACIGMIQFYKSNQLSLKKEEADKYNWVKNRAIECFKNIERRKSNPKGRWTKGVEGARNSIGLSIYMIDINICLEISDVLTNEELKELGIDLETRIKKNLDIIFTKFHHKEKDLFLECFSEKEMFEHFDTRLINPGHGLETIWFILDVLDKIKLEEKEKENYKKKVIKIALSTLNYGWDEKYGGIFYFKDIKNMPLDKLEWSQKLWWVHLEAAVCLAKCIFHSTDEKEKELLWDWYNKIHAYIFDHFYTEKSEFWGYLDRRGDVLIRLKGGKWKGCFHVPRALLTPLLAIISSSEKNCSDFIKTNQLNTKIS